MGSLEPNVTLTPAELADLCQAKALLEHPGMTARLANVLGAPIEKGFQLLPKNWTETVQKATQAALLKALHVAVLTLGKSNTPRRASQVLHKVLAGTSGALGGAFGLAALPLEMPISTAIMLRSIAEIARSEGQDLRQIEARLACLEVFALGGRGDSDDAAENAYWAVRAGLAKAVSEAAAYVARRGVIEETAPAILRLISTIASRFGVIVSEQVAAKAVPILGAAAGSTINVLFTDHFQNMARGHFIVKRLEAKYGAVLVKTIYDSIATRIENHG